MTTRILLVEDNPLEAAEMITSMRRVGFDVVAADDAETGWRRLQEEDFDLLLCDLHLPGENGFALCRRLKQSPRFSRMPVVLLTRFTDPLNVLRGLEAGADGFISKGRSPESSLERIQRVLAQRNKPGDGGSDGSQRVVFLDTEFDLNARRGQLLEVLLSGFEDVVHLNNRYEAEVVERTRIQKSLHDANLLYHSLVETLPLSVFRKDTAGRYTFANRHFCESLGKTAAEICGRTDRELLPSPLAEQYAREDRLVLESGRLLDDIETGCDAAGEPTYTRVRKMPVANSLGERIGIQGIAWDVTDLKRTAEQLRSVNATLENRVAERTRELNEYVEKLERKNAELDQFVFMASHDLQEPIRKLISFSQLLESDLQQDDRRRVFDDLHYITSAARRMQTLVRNLLQLSRVGRSALRRERVDLGRTADAVLEVLSLRIAEMGAVVTRDPLPVVVGDPTTLAQLYQNLIQNALKFVRDEPPRIHLTAEEGVDRWTLGVRDEGIGVEAEYAEQIFAPFQRLHDREKYEGTGIGLAICRSTVERHGGEIWVESEFGRGSHFKFTLPRDEAATPVENSPAAERASPALAQ